MPYDDIPIAHVLNYLLADGFDASGCEDVREWLGEEGKTLADMLGQEASDNFYSDERLDELHGFIQAFDLHELELYLNDNDAHSAVRLRLREGKLVFFAGDPRGVPAITTSWFERHRAQLVDQSG